MKLDKFKRLILGVQFLALLLATAHSQTDRYTPSPVEGYDGSMSYLFLHKAVEPLVPDLFDLSTRDVLDRLSADNGTTPPLSRQRLTYMDGIASSEGTMRIDIIWTLNSENIYVTVDDLSSLGQKLRVLRDDFFASVNVPGFMRIHKSMTVIGDSQTVIDQDGSVSTAPSTRSALYSEKNLALDYYSPDWSRVLQEGKTTDLDGGRQKVVGSVDGTDYVIVRNSDGTFSSITSEERMPGGWTFRVDNHFDDWTTESAVLLPGKRTWNLSLIDEGVEVKLADFHVQLLSLGDKDFLAPQQ